MQPASPDSPPFLALLLLVQGRREAWLRRDRVSGLGWRSWRFSPSQEGCSVTSCVAVVQSLSRV